MLAMDKGNAVNSNFNSLFYEPLYPVRIFSGRDGNVYVVGFWLVFNYADHLEDTSIRIGMSNPCIIKVSGPICYAYNVTVGFSEYFDAMPGFLHVQGVSTIRNKRLIEEIHTLRRIDDAAVQRVQCTRPWPALLVCLSVLPMHRIWQ